MTDHARPVLRKIAAGTVEGRSDGRMCRFLGVPYAAPPVGANRFRDPQPVAPWSGTRLAIDPGPSAYQIVGSVPGIEVVPLIGPGSEGGDDLLTLNLWAPEGAERRPVMVWIHGGGFVVGSKDAPVQDGSSFARDGVICVAINYRLGIEGFVPIPGVPTNLGLRDMLFALRWVQDNVAAFGGDPANVTVFGESAGAMAIADLVTSPLAKGLFRRAIIQSGHGAMVRDLGVARRLVERLAKALKVAPTREGFATTTPAQGWQAIRKVSRPIGGVDLRDEAGHEAVFGISRIIPVYGDDVLPVKPIEALKAGAGRDIEVLIGTNAAEMNLYFVPTGVKKRLPGFLARWLLGKSHPRARLVLRAYGLGRKGRRAGEVFTTALHDLVFRWPARRFAEEHRGRTHVYEFDWHSPACGGELGAAHAMDVPFVFDTLACATGEKGLCGPNPPQELADRIHATWVRFATDGTLPWPEFTRHARRVHRLAADTTVEEPPMAAAAFLPD